MPDSKHPRIVVEVPAWAILPEDERRKLDGLMVKRAIDRDQGRIEPGQMTDDLSRTCRSAETPTR